MLRVLAALGLVVASPAVAQQSESGTAVPTRAVPCAEYPLTLHAAGRDPVVCWDRGCMKLDGENGATPIAKPEPERAWFDPLPEVRTDQVCLGPTCARLGRRLAAAVAEARKDREPQDEPPRLAATRDLKAVIVNDAAWSVPADRPLTFTPPALYRGTQLKPFTSGFVPAGNLLVVWWTTCAGPCTKFSIADSSGRPTGREGEGGGGVFQLDGQRFAVYGEYGALYVQDLGSAKPRGTVPSLTLEAGPVSFIRVDDESVLAMYEKGRGIEVAKIGAWTDPSLPTAVTGTQYLPNCPAR